MLVVEPLLLACFSECSSNVRWDFTLLPVLISLKFISVLDLFNKFTCDTLEIEQWGVELGESLLGEDTPYWDSAPRLICRLECEGKCNTDPGGAVEGRGGGDSVPAPDGCLQINDLK